MPVIAPVKRANLIHNCAFCIGFSPKSSPTGRRLSRTGLLHQKHRPARNS
jgi:hypothetical protein